jgi:hypothetical protein
VQVTAIHQSNFSPTNSSRTRPCVFLNLATNSFLLTHVAFVFSLIWPYKTEQAVESGALPRFTMREDRFSKTTPSLASYYENLEVEEWIQSVAGVLDQGWNDQYAFRSSQPSSKHVTLSPILTHPFLTSPFLPSFLPSLYIKTHSQTLAEPHRKGPYATTSSQLGSTPISGLSVSKLASYTLHIPANSSCVPNLTFPFPFSLSLCLLSLINAQFLC